MKTIAMNGAITSTAVLWAVLGSITPADAQTPAIEQVRTTRACQGCDLSNADLRGLDLSNADLRGANLSNADLSGVILNNADLSGANLYLTKLQNASLKGANLNRINGKSVQLDGADLGGSKLADADLSFASASGALLSAADLSRSNLSDANFSQANLTSAQLVEANLRYTNLSGANASAANFTGAKLLATNGTGANLSSAKFNSADLTGANLTSANLSSADLTGTLLTSAILKDADFTNANLVEAIRNQPSTAQNPSQPSAAGAQPKPLKYTAEESPLGFAQLPTAKTLRAGEFVLDYRQRFYDNESDANGGDTPFFAGPGVRFGITNRLEVAVGAQIFDSGLVTRLGGRIDNPNADVALEAKYRIWQDASKTKTLSGVVSLSGFARGATFNRGGATTQVNGDGIVPAFQLPFTLDVGDKAQFTIAPTLAFFQEDSAVLVPRVPDRGGSFGTTFGVTGAATFRPFNRLMLWGNAFVPFTGNNSLNFKTELPAKTVVFNAGLRYFVNPRLGLDIFATNSYGNLGPLALTGDRQDVGIGAGIVVMPDLLSANRNYPNTFEGNFRKPDTPMTDDGLGFFDGGTVPAGRFMLHFQGGNSGIMAAARYGALRDFEVGTYVDYVFGKVDESEQGISGKVRLLNQSDGAPFTASVVATLGRGNNLLENFLSNDANVFRNSGSDKSFPFIFSGDLDENDLRRTFIGTLSFPLHYQFRPGTAVWLTPAFGFLQRGGGLDLAGLNVGGSIRVVKDISLLAEVGANFAGEGNAFIDNRRADRIPWNVAVRWTPSNLLGLEYDEKDKVRPSFELFFTNRVGASVWHQFRVREQNNPAVGVGVSFPF